MKWRARTRRIILWSATSLTVLLAVAWIGSGWWTLYLARHGTGALIIEPGRLRIAQFQDGVGSAPGFQFAFQRESIPMGWWFSRGSITGVRFIDIPLWAPLAISAAITALAWRQETLARRRTKQNQCPACGYDQSGLKPNTPCPECNAAPALPAK